MVTLYIHAGYTYTDRIYETERVRQPAALPRASETFCTQASQRKVSREENRLKALPSSRPFGRLCYAATDSGRLDGATGDAAGAGGADLRN